MIFLRLFFLHLIDQYVDMKSVIESIEKEYNGEILISYKGKPTGEMINSIIHLAEGKLDFLEPRIKVRKKVFKITVEILQNIIHHDENLNEWVYPSFIFYLFKKGDYFTIISCNRQVETKAMQVYKKIRGFMSMSETELKKTYQEILGNGRFSNKGGAGLGLLEIIRRSNRNLACDILPSDQEGHKLLYLKINVY